MKGCRVCNYDVSKFRVFLGLSDFFKILLMTFGGSCGDIVAEAKLKSRFPSVSLLCPFFVTSFDCSDVTASSSSSRLSRSYSSSSSLPLTSSSASSLASVTSSSLLLTSSLASSSSSSWNNDRTSFRAAFAARDLQLSGDLPQINSAQ